MPDASEEGECSLTPWARGIAPEGGLWAWGRQGPLNPLSSGLLVASLRSAPWLEVHNFGIFRSPVGFQSRHFRPPPRLPSLFSTHTCSFRGSCRHQTFFLFLSEPSLSLSLSPPFPSPPPSPPLPSPRKEKIQTLTNKISAIPSEGELRQEPRISWKKCQRALKASVV